MAEWITAICAVLGTLGAMGLLYVGVRTDIRALQTTVTSLDKQMALLTRDQHRSMSMMAAILGESHPLVRDWHQESS